jgi:hypothetical protein
MRSSLLILVLTALQIGAAELVAPVIPQSLGVNIHFTDARPGEMKMLADAGFRFVRMDFDWAKIESTRGRYDYSAYDRLVKSLDEFGIRAVFILDYANPLYDDNRSPDSDEGRRAFARWAAESVQHFAGKKILWEMYNEPNITPFWRPKPNTDDYVKLALAVGKAIREAAPGEAYVGPACSGVDLPFLEACFKAGLLEYWDAVSIHPYRQQDPETVEDDYRDVRLLIARYAPKDKKIPILSGEWGYSSAWDSFDEDRQAKMLARQWLTNLANDVPLSIWYDWHDDGPDPKEAEHHFGTVRFPPLAPGESRGEGAPYDAKPGYLAARTLSTQLAGFTFNKRLALARDDDYMLLFTRGNDEVRVVAWTTSRKPRDVTLPASPGAFTVVSHTGEKLPARTADEKGLPVTLTDAPQYLVPENPNELLHLAAAWGRAPAEIERPRPIGHVLSLAVTMEFHNPLSVAVTVETPRQRVTVAPADACEIACGVVPVAEDPDARYVACRLECRFESFGKLAQPVAVIPSESMRVKVLPRLGQLLPIRVRNDTNRAFKGALAVDCPSLPAGTLTPIPLLAPNEESVTLHAALPQDKELRVGVKLLDDDGQTQVALNARRFVSVPLDAAGMEIHAEGDEKVQSSQSFAIQDAPPGLPAPGATAVKIDYHFDPGWKFACLLPKPQHQPIDGKPAQLGMWLKGDGSGNWLRMRFVDSTGQTFQPDGPRLDFTDWRYVEFPLDGAKSGHWGGAKDGEVHYPIKLETLLLIDSATRQETGGVVYLSSPTLIYRD